MKPNQRLIPVVGILAIGAIVVITHQVRNRRTSDHLVASGTAEATEAQLGFQLTGRIADIAVREGDRMKADSVLATLDSSEQQARLEQTQAQLDAARALLSEMERGSRDEEIAQARANRDAAAQRMEDAKRDLDRALTLRDGGAVSQEAYDKARLAYDVAKNQAEGAQEQFALVRAGPRKERIDAQRAQVAQAEAAVRQIDATLANMTIRSAFDGIVTVRHREPGEIVPAGAAVLTLMNPDDRWVRIYVPETRIGAVRLGRRRGSLTRHVPRQELRGRGVLHRERGGVHAEDGADVGGAGEARLRRQGPDHRRSLARPEARNARRRDNRSAAAMTDSGARRSASRR